MINFSPMVWLPALCWQGVEGEGGVEGGFKRGGFGSDYVHVVAVDYQHLGKEPLYLSC